MYVISSLCSIFPKLTHTVVGCPKLKDKYTVWFSVLNEEGVTKWVEDRNKGNLE